MRYTPTTTDLMPDMLTTDNICEFVRVDEGEQKLVANLALAAQAYAEDYCDQPLFSRVYTVPLRGYTDVRLIGAVPGGVTLTNKQGEPIPHTDELPAYSLIAGNLYWDRRVYESGFPALGSLTYTAGYTRDNLPDNLRLALLTFIADRYDNRGNNVSERITVVDRLLQPFKRYA